MLEGHINWIEFKSGLRIDLEPNHIILLVGANSAGKTACLNDIRGLISSEKYQPIVLKDLNLVKVTTVDDVVKRFSPLVNEGGWISLGAANLHERQLASTWNQKNVGDLYAHFLISELSTRSRLSDCDPPINVDTRKSFKAVHPFQKMLRDDLLEAKVSGAFRSAFRRDFIIYRGGGETVPAYVGQRPLLVVGEDRASRTYLDRVEQLPGLEKEGDGVRSFVSIIGRVLTEDRPIQLIDEPESFLHPPQVKLISEAIVDYSASRQTFIATHSTGVLTGSLRDVSRVIVVRLGHRNSIATAVQLLNCDLKLFWTDPLLRFSNVLDGIFHDGVVVTEGDFDCRFFDAFATKITPADDRFDLHFTYSGGEDRLPTVIKAMKALGVPVAAIADFDILNDAHPLRPLVETQGGDWNLIEPDFMKVKKSVESKSAFVRSCDLKQQVSELMATLPPDESAPKTTLKKLRDLAKNASPWDLAKSVGLSCVQPGQDTVAATRLLMNLKGLGIFVVPKGEMEGFCRSIGGHGIRWVEEVLARDLNEDKELNDARIFVAEIVAYLRSD